ncbi:MAG TPA: alkaline phosphatase family protein, partial [Acidimicrobiales bacterium]
MRRPARWKTAAVAGAVLAILGFTGGLTRSAAAVKVAPTQHVLLISVDGLHASDLSQCEANSECPNLANLANFGTTYSNAHTSRPSDSAPGLMALATGGDPKLTGVYYDDSYDRTMFTPPAQTANGIQNCTGTPGVETQYFENVDVGAPTFSNPNGTRPVMNAALDQAQFAYAKVNGKCVPVAPNDFLRTNSIFSVAHDAGLYTAWADKHPVYNAQVAGHGTPNSVDDPFNTEINADIIPATLTDTRGTLITFPHPNPTGDPNGYFITDFVENTEAYDHIKVDGVLNQIDGMNSAGTKAAPVPAIFGMNFQTVSVAQKLVDPLKSCKRNTGGGCDPSYFPGGYEPGTFQFTPQLSNGLQWVDQE